MEKMKYVRLKQFDQIIIFPCVMEHSSFRGMNPITAGFCYINIQNRRVDCFGESVSLNLKSGDREDVFQATKQVFGIDDALSVKP